MKHIKKLAALALAIMMLMGLAIPAAAAEGDITITMTTSESGASVDGHTYNVYQIFTGTVATDGKTLTDAAFGANYPAPTKVNENGETVNMTAREARKELEGLTGAEAAAELKKAISGDPVAVLNDANEHKADVPVGYYLIIDVTKNLPENETKSAFILQAIGDTNIKSKHDNAPIVTKKIDDTNDSVDAENEITWHDSADHDIGDKIPFQLNAVIPVSFTAFKTADVDYPFTFHDTEEQGLTFQQITAVYVLDSDGTKTPVASTAYTLVKDPEDGHTFDVVFSDLTAIDAIEAGSTLVVEYESRLNESAILGSQGNVNKVFGEFRNFYEPETPKYTPEDTVIAFTYKVVVNKVDEDGEALAGAEFTLEKYNKATNTWIAIKQVETEPGTIFTFKGLDDGEYRLTETKTPDGYNTIAPVEFTVTANHDIEWNTQDRADVLNTLSGEAKTGEITFTATDDLSTLESDVENKSGVVLPETGGTGTTLFYIMGGVMVLVAVILLVTKKRMSNTD